MDYTVQKGDTIAKITKETGASWQQLKALNPDAVGRSKTNGNWFFREGMTVTTDSSNTFAKNLEKAKQKVSAQSTGAIAGIGQQGAALAGASAGLSKVTSSKTIENISPVLAIEPAPLYLPDQNPALTGAGATASNGTSTNAAVLASSTSQSTDTNTSSDETVVASWYGKQHHGKTMANGKPFNMYGSTIAHKDIPLGTKVLLENPTTGQKATATVTDRGPFVAGRDIDVSYGLAKRLSLKDQGVGSLVMKVL